MNLNINRPYPKLYLKHWLKFITQLELIQPGDRVVCAVSGGADSLATLMGLQLLKEKLGISSLVCAHINHGTRAENLEEQELVESLCSEIGVEFIFEKLKIEAGSNFELRARKARNKFFKSVAFKFDKIVYGHHIDDSFEWSLLQSFKTSHTNAVVGIPVVNGKKIRPNMCMTRNQIIKFIHSLNIKYVIDPSNSDNSYERNYIRNKVVPTIAIKHPQYLKHYVNQQNEKLRLMDKHVKDNKKTKFKVVKHKHSVEIFKLESGEDYSGLGGLITEGVHHLSDKSRGSIHLQIKKTIEAHRNHKLGPMLFTGNIDCYITRNYFYLTSRKVNKSDKKAVELIKRNKFKYKKYSLNDFKKTVQKSIKKGKVDELYPFVVIINKINNPVLGNAVKRKHPWLPLTTEHLCQSDLPFQYALSLIKFWSMPKNCEKKLSLCLLSTELLDKY